jgi:thiamine monophosphate synthase
MFLKKIKYYYFINNFNPLELKKINNIKNLFLIYYDTKQSNIEDIYKIKNFAKKNKIKLYISNYNRKFSNIKIDGIHIPSSNKKIILNLKKGLDIIGTAHNQLEFYFKKKQGCSKIFLSPLFKTKKYSDNKILNTNKFRLISREWLTIKLALAGIKKKNFNKLKDLEIQGVGTASYFK